jgi:hypothetical protein
MDRCAFQRRAKATTPLNQTISQGISRFRIPIPHQIGPSFEIGRASKKFIKVIRAAKMKMPPDSGFSALDSPSATNPKVDAMPYIDSRRVSPLIIMRAA